MIDGLARYLIGAIVGVALAFIVASPAQPVTFDRVVVPPQRIVELEPPARPPTIIERVRFITIQPRQVATAPGGAAPEVSAFCRPVVLEARGEDSVQESTHTPVLVLRSGSYDRSWWNPLSKGELALTGFTNLGDLQRSTYSTRSSFDFRTSGDSVIVRQGRGALVGDVVDLAGRLSLLVLGVLVLGGVL